MVKDPALRNREISGVHTQPRPPAPGSRHKFSEPPTPSSGLHRQPRFYKCMVGNNTWKLLETPEAFSSFSHVCPFLAPSVTSHSETTLNSQ